MKKVLVLSLLIFCLLNNRAGAQVKLSVNINIGDQPAWGPTGYDHVEYYYLPDIDVYYNVPKHQYVYFEGGAWVFRPALPPRFARYDLYGGYKVIVNEQKPFLRADYYRSNYARFKNWHGEHQVIIRESKEERYRPNRERDERERREGMEHH